MLLRVQENFFSKVWSKLVTSHFCYTKSRRMFAPFALGVMVIVSFKVFYTVGSNISLYTGESQLKSEVIYYLNHHDTTNRKKVGIIICGAPNERVPISHFMLDIKRKNCPRSQLPCCWYVRRNHLYWGSLGPGKQKSRSRSPQS